MAPDLPENRRAPGGYTPVDDPKAGAAPARDGCARSGRRDRARIWPVSDRASHKDEIAGQVDISDQGALEYDHIARWHEGQDRVGPVLCQADIAGTMA